MKINSPQTLALLIGLAMIACNNDEPTARQPEVFALRLEQADYQVEFSYDAQGRHTGTKMSSEMPNGVILESNYQYFYTVDGKFEKCVSDNGFRMEYTYQGDQIVRTDEFIGDHFSQYHAFEYDSKGRLKQIVSWQNIPEEGGWIPHAKETYAYDNRGNLVLQKAYYYNTGTDTHNLHSSFEYSEYDNQPETESLFNNLAFNPILKFRTNNPGKMVVKNAHGNTYLIDEYSYTYSSKGYLTAKTTRSTYVHNGQTGSYETLYFYGER